VCYWLPSALLSVPCFVCPAFCQLLRLSCFLSTASYVVFQRQEDLIELAHRRNWKRTQSRPSQWRPLSSASLLQSSSAVTKSTVGSGIIESVHASKLAAPVQLNCKIKTNGSVGVGLPFPGFFGDLMGSQRVARNRRLRVGVYVRTPSCCLCDFSFSLTHLWPLQDV
jgi:hypothetical protein